MSYQGLRVIDGHSHFPGERWGKGRPSQDSGNRREEALRKAREDSQAKWRQMWGFPKPEQGFPGYDEQADRWAAELEKYGIEKIVFVTDGGNDSLASVVRRHPDKFVGFAHHNPFEENAPQELERAVKELGLKGYKLIAPALDGDISDKSLWPLWEMVERLEIPMLIHFGPLGGVGGLADHQNMNPLKIHDVAKAFPTIPIIIPHFGCGFPNELLRLCWACSNIYTDTSGSNEWVRWMIPDTTLRDLFRKFLETIGPERIIFGTDSSWFPRGFSAPYLQEQIRICRSLGMKDADMDLIFAGNIERILNL